MKISSFIRLGSAGVVVLIAGTGIACKPAVMAPAPAKVKTAVVPVTVEVRPDGLAYLPGAAAPFTGEAITAFAGAPWLVHLKEPYSAGQRDGDKLELFKDGTTKTLRRYEKGLPKYAASFHKNGQKKFELNLNARDKGEGPYKRWYPDGAVESTCGLDAEERWHGEMKEWTPAGELKTHHIFQNGVLRKVIFETPETTVARKAAGLELQPAPAETTPAAGAVPAADP